MVQDFEKALESADEGDFVYLDPPYPPRSDTAFFAHYSKDRFTWNDHLRLAKVFEDLDAKGCLVMLSNAWQAKVRRLYKEFSMYRLGVLRWVGSNGDRFPVHEAVVTNYDPESWTHR